MAPRTHVLHDQVGLAKAASIALHRRDVCWLLCPGDAIEIVERAVRVAAASLDLAPDDVIYLPAGKDSVWFVVEHDLECRIVRSWCESVLIVPRILSLGEGSPIGRWHDATHLHGVVLDDVPSPLFFGVKMAECVHFRGLVDPRATFDVSFLRRRDESILFFLSDNPLVRCTVHKAFRLMTWIVPRPQKGEPCREIALFPGRAESPRVMQGASVLVAVALC